MRYFFGFLITIGLIVLILFLLLSGGGSKSTPVKPFDLRDYTNSDTRAQLIVDGPVVSDKEHQQIEIDVDANQVAMTVYTGYERTIQKTKSFPSNNNAYNNFLYGLQRSSFSNIKDDKTLRDSRGFCVEGERFNFSFDKPDKNLLHSWYTSCGQGTFKGNIATTLYLFKNQVPSKDYDDLTSDLSFSF